MINCFEILSRYIYRGDGAMAVSRYFMYGILYEVSTGAAT
jgi:hypothetical protein